jgi:hypothetical protein
MKGFTAIEIVFMMFILIVVVIVVIQLFMRNVTTERIAEAVSQVEELKKYSYMKDVCSRACEKARTATSSKERLAAMAAWCFTKITERGKEGIDINSDGIYTGFYVVGGYPYCEDGTYCFHFFSCDLGGVELDRKECRRILCEYYTELEGDADRASRIINSTVILPGRCKVKPELLSQGTKLVTNNPSWWYVRLYKNIDCSRLLSGEETEEETEEEEGGGPPIPGS